jgi:transposase-like protein
MKVEISVSKMVQVFREIQEQPEKVLEMVRAIENWRNRNLASMRRKYLFCDGVYFEMRVARTGDWYSIRNLIEGNFTQSP